MNVLAPMVSLMPLTTLMCISSCESMPHGSSLKLLPCALHRLIVIGPPGSPDTAAWYEGMPHAALGTPESPWYLHHVMCTNSYDSHCMSQLAK